MRGLQVAELKYHPSSILSSSEKKLCAQGNLGIYTPVHFSASERGTSAMCSVGGTLLPKLPPLPVSAQPLFLLQGDVFPHDPSVHRALLWLYCSLSGALIAVWLMRLHRYQLQMSCSECLQGGSAKAMCDVSGAPAWLGRAAELCMQRR